MKIGKNFCGRTYGQMDTPDFQSTRSSVGDDLTRMWANAQPDGRPAEHRWRPLINAAKCG